MACSERPHPCAGEIRSSGSKERWRGFAASVLYRNSQPQDGLLEPTYLTTGARPSIRPGWRRWSACTGAGRCRAGDPLILRSSGFYDPEHARNQTCSDSHKEYRATIGALGPPVPPALQVPRERLSVSRGTSVCSPGETPTHSALPPERLSRPFASLCLYNTPRAAPTTPQPSRGRPALATRCEPVTPSGYRHPLHESLQ
jgi:hypothetical protein